MTATEHIIMYIYNSIDLEIMQELYRISIDDYTFQREIEWYFYEDVTAKRLLRGIPRRLYTQKSFILEDTNWAHVARHFSIFFDKDNDLHHSRELNSYHNSRYYKDDGILDSGRYELIRMLGTNQKSHKYIIKLKPVRKFI